MIHAFYLAAILTLSSPHVPDLVPFQEGGLWGYKNWQNEWVIEPQFHAAFEFSDGIATVRQNGYYQFIDENGQRLNTDPTAYDFAHPYHDERCIAHIDEGYVLLNEDLGIITDGAYDLLSNHGKFYLANRENEYFILDSNGEEIDGPFTGQFVQLPADDRYLLNILVEGEWRTQLKSTEGEVLLETLESHHGHSTDHLLTMSYENGYPTLHVYTMDGDKLFDVSGSSFDVNNVEFYGFPMIIEKYERQAESPNELYNLPKHYATLSSRAKVTELSSEWEFISPIQNERCVGQHVDGGYFLLDEEGQVVNKQSFRDFRLLQFHHTQLLSNGTDITRTNDGWALIDEDGNTLLTCPSEEVDQLRNYMPERGMAIFTHPENNRHFLIWVLETNEVFGVYDHISLAYSNEYIMVQNEHYTEYISRNGQRISHPKWIAPVPMNIDAKMDAVVHVGSPPLKGLNAIEGWANSENIFTPYAAANPSSGNHVLISDPEVHEDYPISTSRLVEFINLSSDTLIASVQDSRLHAVIEAKNEEGEWVSIQTYRSSWCGNSYHHVYLPPGNEWTWRIPEFEGGMKTELRVAIYNVMTWENGEHSEPFNIFSEPYKGSINPAQLWRENQYSQRGLMHPYL
ncbi:MAG: WG repeat-containing protein [Flavobacteriia bacterium]|nr:WG repeat-containing protein [Flavobacteriia bacterium]